MTWNDIISNPLFQQIVTATIKVVGGLIVVWILFKIINVISRRIEKRLSKNSKVDTTVTGFIAPLVRKVLKFFIVICYIGFVGIETSSIAAAITSAGLALGLALQGSLSNFAGGFVILVMRPFKVGDYIDTGTDSGTVESIQIFYTTLVTPDNRVVKIPNGGLSNTSVTNYSTKNTRRCDLTFSIAYDADVNKAKEIIMECANKTGLVLKDPAPFINVSSHSASSIDIVSRFWVKGSDYWTLHFNLLESVKSEFDKNNIEIPYNKLDINVKK